MPFLFSPPLLQPQAFPVLREGRADANAGAGSGRGRRKGLCLTPGSGQVSGLVTGVVSESTPACLLGWVGARGWASWQ